MKITLLCMLLGISCWTGAATEDTSPANTTRELQIDFEPGVVFNQPQCVVENGFDYSGNDIGSAPAPLLGIAAFPAPAAPGAMPARSAIMSNDAGCQQEQNIDYVGSDLGSASAARATDCCTSTKGRMVVRAGFTSGSPYLEAATCGLENGVDYAAMTSVVRDLALLVAVARSAGILVANRKDATVRRDGVISGQSTANPPAPSCAMEQNVDYDGATMAMPEAPIHTAAVPFA
ncbi:hypothetical protein GQ600_19075 [Phytophthora cactorum]|nr:hypothetical protein GQ600_19075 [Phytophthora cactorum]